MNRRDLLRVSGGAVAIGFGVSARLGSAVAQGATLSELGLPELKVTMTDAGFELSTPQLETGWTLVTLENKVIESASTSDFMMLPADQTVESVMALLDLPSDQVPDWVYETTWAGGPFGVTGTSAQAVVNLTPGSWMVWSAGESYAPATLTVVSGGRATPASQEIAADMDITLLDFSFAGLGQAIPAGKKTWKVTNAGQQPHVMLIFAVPNGTTVEQFLAAFMEETSGSPEAGALDLSAIEPKGGCGDISTGVTAWHSIELGAGTHAAVCFAPDKDTGAPHIMLGMGTVFTVV